MKKITDFIINKRYIILAVFIVFTIVSVILSSKVNINSDITKYLPNTSETRIGMDIMDEEFSEAENSSSFYLMFKNINEEEKDDIYNYLKNVNGVAEVNYEHTEKYNKDNATLFIINVDENSNSEIAANIYNQIVEKYEDYEIYTSGSIAVSNEEILPTWILVVSITSAIIILIIMCESYIEPFLFLAAILMAVILNSGTNIIFDSVSSVTSSISAILQMALSMDYSIMLINRFRQEKETELNKVEAMKKALYNAFKSISSSSITTIVGLLALIFMSFTIGRDLGLVLAKGVLLSLITIFFVLPTLILMCDKLIIKTKKKSLNIKLTILGKLNYKLRYILTILFIGLFVGSYLSKGNLGILFTASEADEIAKVFGENNQIAVIYNNEDEEKIASYIEKLEENEKVDEILAYGNTINEELDYKQLTEKLKDLGSDVTIDEYLLKILYYKYNNPNEDNKMEISDLYSFIHEDVYSNENISKTIDNQTKENIEKLKFFTNKNEVNKKRTPSDISSILGISKENVEDILTYYNSKNSDLKISINDFVKFMNKDILTNPKYSKNISEEAKLSLAAVSTFADKDKMQNKLTSDQMADLFGIDKESVNDLYMYYISVNDIDTKITLSEFANFVLTDIAADPSYSSSFNKETMDKVKILKTFSNTDLINKKMTMQEISSLTGVNEKVILQLFLLNNISDTQITLMQFVDLVIKSSSNEAVKNSINKETMQNILLLQNIMKSAQNKTTYSYKELSNFIGIEERTLKNVYTLYEFKNIVNVKITPLEFINFILNNKDNQMLAGSFNQNTLNTLENLQVIINETVSGKKYDSKEMSKVLGINKNSLDLLYGVYSTKYINKSISLENLVEFILSDVVNNRTYANSFDEASKEQLKSIKTIMKASVNNTKYTKEESFKILNNLNKNLDKSMLEQLYIYYGSVKEYDETWKMTIDEFVKFLNDNILEDNRFESFIEEDMKASIKESRKTVGDSKELLVGRSHSRLVINTSFDFEGEETFKFIQEIKDTLGENINEFYVIGDSAMAYEMSKTFGREFDYISILTMVAIFVVVAITFKSIILPLILVCIIQCAVYMTMGILSFLGGTIYFIAILIVQSILMGATIDYAIVYTSYYLEHRKELDIKDALIEAYNKSIHTILTSASILIIVTFIIGKFATEITAKICKALAEGTLCSAILILVLLPGILAACDRLIVKKDK